MQSRLRPGLVWPLLLIGACGDNSSPPGLADANLGAIADAAVECVPVTGEPDLALELVADGFDKPVHASAPRGDDRIFVIEQHTGKIWIVLGQVRSEPFLDLGDEVSTATEQGLLSLAFHPDYAHNGRFFITYTRDDNALVLEEWHAAADPNLADRSTRRPILVIPQGTNFHHGGRAAFGPDGLLYLGHGDGGPQHDPEGHAQDRGALLGKFLRIDVDREEGELAYGIPSDNPFVGMSGVRPEIYAYGVRNPWGWSIDPATGNLYFGDVGLARWEEVDVIPATSGGGQNYGWPILMGNECEMDGCDTDGLTAPLHAYGYVAQARCAAIGGPVYRGCRMPGHHGRFFFTDFCAGFLHSLRWSELEPDDVSIVDHASVSGQLPLVSGFGLDGNGEMLMIDWEGGKLYRIVPAP